jgi:hypothetical protein
LVFLSKPGVCRYPSLHSAYICGMLTSEEEEFLAFWANNRERQKTSVRPFVLGLSGGFAIGAAVMILLSLGWYERANMEANSRMSGVVFMFAILVISFFLAYFYRKFRWEMLEQRYLELLARKNKLQNQAVKQQSSS